jgi:hypothetical protein
MAWPVKFERKTSRYARLVFNGVGKFYQRLEKRESKREDLRIFAGGFSVG